MVLSLPERYKRFQLQIIFFHNDLTKPHNGKSTEFRGSFQVSFSLILHLRPGKTLTLSEVCFYNLQKMVIIFILQICWRRLNEMKLKCFENKYHVSNISWILYSVNNSKVVIPRTQPKTAIHVNRENIVNRKAYDSPSYHIMSKD